MAKSRRSIKKPSGQRTATVYVLVPLILGIITLVLLLDMDYNILPFLDLGTAGEPFHTGLIILVILTFIWFSLRFMGFLVEVLAAPKVGSYAAVRTTWKTVNYTVWAIVLAFIFFFFMGGADTAILSIGLIGAALTFVLQKPLLNILGWMFISYNRMYKIGDRISIGDVKGYVTDIKVMHTDLYEMGGWMNGETFTGRIAQIPNGLLFDGPVYNYTRDSPYIWDEVTNLVTYESDVDKAKRHILDAANEIVGNLMRQNHDAYRRHLELHDLDDALPSEPTLRMELSDSGVNISAIYWTTAESRRRTKAHIVEGIWRRFSDDPDVEIAYPHMELVKHEKS